MNPAAASSRRKLSANQRAALVKLLADDDPQIYRLIRKKILSAGPEAVEWMSPHLLSNDPVLRRRARDIVGYFERQDADTQFLGFCLKHGEEFDLEHGAWLFARTAHPDINIAGYQAVLDNYAAELRERLDFEADSTRILTTINQYLFGELGFAGNEQNYYDPDNSYLNRVIDRRTGNPINLCLLYMLVARRLRLPLTGIGLPGHFICRFQSSADEVYVDVFNQGRLLSKADCVQYLLQGSHSLREDYLTPVSARRMLMRICSNLHKIFLDLGRGEETTRIQRYIIALAR